jgi:C4-dicarboxylate-binding protein DctP
MKKTLSMTLALLLTASLLTGCGGGKPVSTPAPGGSSAPELPTADGSATYTIKLAHGMMENTPAHQGLLEFQKLVSEKTNGQVEVTIFPAGQMGSDTELAEMLQTDAVDAALLPTAKLSGFYAPLQVLDLPFLFPSKEVTYEVIDNEEFKNLLFPAMSDLGFHCLNVWESGFKQLTANSPIHTPDDLKGLKMRVMESPLLIAQYQALGANPVAIDFSETYNSLQQHAADGQENPLTSIVNMKFYEVQTDMTISNHGYLAYLLMFSNGAWNSLPADLQQAINEAAAEAVVVERQLNDEMEAGYIQTIKDSGTTVYELTADEMDAFAQVVQPVHEQFRDVIGSDVLDKTYELVEAAKS